jgi:hypothetical protein
MKKLLCLIAGLCLCACSTTMTASTLKTELITKQAVVTSAVAASVGCQTGLMSKENCASAFAAYQMAQLGINTTLQIMDLNTTDTDLKAQIQAAITAGFPVLSFDRIEK